MNLYFAGPMFTTSEREWNAEVSAALRAAGHESICPRNVGGIDWADALVAIMDGPTPDSGTSWEVGYAFRKKPIVLVRTDFRAMAGNVGAYNPMLAESAVIRLDSPAALTAEVVNAVLQSLELIERRIS